MSTSSSAAIDTYISIDVETAGPIPSQYSMLSIGACTLENPRRKFYIELKPDKDGVLSEAIAISNLSMEKLAEEMLKNNPELKKQFEEKLKSDEAFSNSSKARLDFFYDRSPYPDKQLNVYPILRIE